MMGFIAAFYIPTTYEITGNPIYKISNSIISGTEPYAHLLVVPSKVIEVTVAVTCGYFIQDIIFGIRTQIPSWKFDLFHHCVSSVGLAWAPVHFQNLHHLIS